VVVELGHFGKQIRNTWTVLKNSAGEGWRSWTDRVGNEKALHRVKGEMNIVHAVNRRKEGRKEERKEGWKEGRLTGLVTSCLGTVV
jgi:hypothetical protein